MTLKLLYMKTFTFVILGVSVLIETYVKRQLAANPACTLISCDPTPDPGEGVVCVVKFDDRLGADQVAAIAYLCGTVAGSIMLKAKIEKAGSRG